MYSEIATIGTFGGRCYISSGKYFTLVLVTTLSLNEAGIHLDMQ